MGYFPNSVSGDIYESQWCVNCAHHKPDDGGCAVWLAHLVYNYDQQKQELLDLLIPRDGIDNLQCKMFHQVGDRCPETKDMFGV